LKAQISVAALAVSVVAVSSAGAVASPIGSAAKKGEPLVKQMLVKRDGTTTLRSVRAKRTTVQVKDRTCVVPAATALASVLQTSWRRHIRLRDYGSCSNRPVDSAGLFVKAIREDVNRGLNGWVYKVGRKLGTAGGADPAGPFGDGRLRTGAEVVWLYCVFVESSCQRSLEVTADVDGDEVSATVTGYDDAGDGVRVAGARVTARGAAGSIVRRTDSNGRVALSLPAAGAYTLRATKPGLIPAFPEKVRID